MGTKPARGGGLFFLGVGLAGYKGEEKKQVFKYFGYLKDNDGVMQFIETGPEDRIRIMEKPGRAMAVVSRLPDQLRESAFSSQDMYLFYLPPGSIARNIDADMMSVTSGTGK
jgi:hypothetical protein